jgi:hypothetical protein
MTYWHQKCVGLKMTRFIPNGLCLGLPFNCDQKWKNGNGKSLWQWKVPFQCPFSSRNFPAMAMRTAGGKTGHVESINAACNGDVAMSNMADKHHHHVLANISWYIS